MPPKYSPPECERRFLATALPPLTGAGHLLEDRYLDGSRRRLRRQTAADGMVWKLARADMGRQGGGGWPD